MRPLQVAQSVLRPVMHPLPTCCSAWDLDLTGVAACCQSLLQDLQCCCEAGPLVCYMAAAPAMQSL